MLYYNGQEYFKACILLFHVNYSLDVIIIREEESKNMGTWVSANGHEGVCQPRKRRQMKSRRFFRGVAVFKGIKKASYIICLFFHFSSPACFSPAMVKKTISCGLSFYNLFV